MPRPAKRGRPAPVRASRAPPRSPSAELESDRNNVLEQKTEDRGRTRTSRSAGKLTMEEEDAIRTANRSRDAAFDRLANDDAITSGNNDRDGSSGSSVEVGRRIMETPAHRRDTTGLDLADDSIFGDLGDSFADGEIPQGLRSTDTSVISLSNFRSRSRQSSFIGRNDPPIRPSSRGGNTPGFASSFNIGAFRRRAREPSILGTSRKPLQESSKTAPDPELDSESEDDFEPEAESTPLNNRRKTRQSEELRRASSPGAPESLNLKKRKSEDAHHSSIRPDKVSRTDDADEVVGDSDSELSDAPSPQQPDQDSDSELSELSSPQEPPGLFRRPVTPINDDEINAPPASSGSESENVWPDIRTLAKKRRRPSITTPSKLDNLSDISSPPSLTHSPNFEEARGRTRGRPAPRQQASPKLTTADLTSLLPKRRYRKARDPLGLDSDEELDATDLGDEDDELSYLDTHATRRRKESRPPSRATSARPTSRVRRAPALKSKQAQASKRPASRNAESYSRRSSDRENEDDNTGEEEDAIEDAEDESRFVPLADDTFDVGAVTSSGETLSADELKQASRKFKEVDRWELDFEEVTETPSSQDGR